MEGFKMELTRKGYDYNFVNWDEVKIIIGQFQGFKEINGKDVAMIKDNKEGKWLLGNADIVSKLKDNLDGIEGNITLKISKTSETVKTKAGKMKVFKVEIV